MHDDNALRRFVVDPISDAEGKWNLTKAERAVLRRTVSNLSNNSVNGYSIDRSLSSYKRSIRLLQNVLHHVGSKMVQDTLEPQDDSYPYQIMVYYPIIPDGGDPNFTCKPNSAVDADSGPYAASTQTYTVSLPNSSPTVKEVMDAVNQQYGDPIPYETVIVEGNEYVVLFDLGGQPIIADLSNPCYKYNPQTNPNPDYVFWFYTVDGTPSSGGTPHPGGMSGVAGQSFAEFNLKPGQIVFWQLIAPDHRYGFQSCAPHNQNKYAKSLQA